MFWWNFDPFLGSYKLKGQTQLEYPIKPKLKFVNNALVRTWSNSNINDRISCLLYNGSIDAKRFSYLLFHQNFRFQKLIKIENIKYKITWDFNQSESLNCQKNKSINWKIKNLFCKKTKKNKNKRQTWFRHMIYNDVIKDLNKSKNCVSN